jgi:hypothetical protein
MPSWAHGGASRRDSVAAAAREVETGYFSSRIYSETTSHPIYFLAWKSELTAEHRGGSVSAYSMDWNVLYEGEEDDFLLKASSALLLPTGRLLASSAETTFRLLLVVVHFVNAEIGWTFMDLCLHWAFFLSFPTCHFRISNSNRNLRTHVPFIINLNRCRLNWFDWLISRLTTS